MSIDASLGTLSAKIGLNTASLQAGIGQARAHFKSLDGVAATSASGLGGTFQKAGMVAAAGIAVAGAAALAFAVKSAGAFKEVGGEVLKLQRFTGGTAESMSKLRFAAQQSGVDADKLANSMKFLSKAVDGNKPAFDKYGIATVDASGKTLAVDKILANAADKFKTLPNGAEKSALALQLFGRAGTDMIPMLNRGSAGLKELGDQAKKYGLVLTNENLVAVKAATKASREQAAAMQGLQVQVGQNVLPILTKLTQALSEGLLVVMPALSSVINATVVPALGLFVDVLAGVLRFVTAYPGPVKALAAAIGAFLVPALVAWAAAQAAAIATSVVGFLATVATSAVAAAGSVRLMTGSLQAGTVAMTGFGVATTAGLAILALAFLAWQRHKESLAAMSSEVVASSSSEKAAIGALRAEADRLDATFASTRPKVNRLTGDLDKNSKAAMKGAEAAEKMREDANALELKLAKAGVTAGEVADEFTKQGLAVQTVGGKMNLTADQVTELAAAMKIDLTKDTAGATEALTAQVQRLGITSVATLKLADANKVLGDWTKDATAKSSAFASALDAVVGTKIASAAADRAYNDSLSALQQNGVDGAKKLADANRTVQSTIRGLTSATEDRQAAEEDLQAILNPTARTKEEANLGASDAQIGVQRAALGVRRAEEELGKLRGSGKATPDEIRAAELDLADARNNVVRAAQRQADAQQRINELTPAGIRGTDEYKDAVARLGAAEQVEADAKDAKRNATADAEEIERDNLDRQRDLGPLVEAVAKATLDQANNTYALTGSMVAAKAVIDGHVGDLQRVLEKLGLSKDQAADLVGKYGLLPKDINTIIGITDNASGPLADLLKKFGVDGIPSGGLGVGPLSILAGAPAATKRAAGGLITRPEVALIGEAGPEVVLPLSDPGRMAALIAQAGIGAMFNGGYTPGTGQTGTTQNVTLHLDAPQDAGIVAQARLASQIVGWQLDRSGRG